MIVFIPTKGRFNTRTYKLFVKEGIEVKHFIEPDELDLYDVPNKISILQNGKGIGYVRNFMLDYARKNNYEWVLMCDDDVEAFGVFDGKTRYVGASIWFDILEKAKQLPYELIGISYRQFSWCMRRSYSINRTFAEVCVLMNISKISWNYRSKFDTKEDRDFVLQSVAHGHGVLNLSRYWFGAPRIGSNQGGLHSEYRENKDKIASNLLREEWKPFIKIVKKNNRIDIQADIVGLARYKNKKVV